MITTSDTPNKLPGAVLAYKIIQAFITGIILAAASLFFPQTQGLKYIIVPSLVIFSVGYAVVWWNLYSYVLSSTAITVNSGVLFRSSKTVIFNDLQSADATTGPLLMMLGLSRFVGFTASPAQLDISSYTQNGRTTTSTTRRPDVDVILPKADAAQIAAMAREGHIQKVQTVA